MHRLPKKINAIFMPVSAGLPTGQSVTTPITGQALKRNSSSLYPVSRGSVLKVKVLRSCIHM